MIPVDDIRLNGLQRANRNRRFESMGDGVEASITISAYGSMRRAGDDSPSRVAPQDFMIISCPSSLLGQVFLLYEPI